MFVPLSVSFYNFSFRFLSFSWIVNLIHRNVSKTTRSEKKVRINEPNGKEPFKRLYWIMEPEKKKETERKKGRMSGNEGTRRENRDQ